MDVTTATTVQDLERLRGAWSALQGDAVTTDLDYNLTLLEQRARVERPHVVLFERGGRPAGMVVARLESVQLASKIGYKTVYRPRVRALRVAYDGMLGEASGDLAPHVVSELMAALRRREADIVLLPNLRTDGPLFAAVTKQPALLLRQHIFDRKVHRRLRLPDSFDAFLGSLSRRTREGIRRNERRLLRTIGDQMSLRALEGPESIEAFFAAARPVAEATYQGSLGVGVQGDELELALTRLAGERGWFRARVLYLGERPIAFWHGYAYRGVFQTHVPGYLPSYRELNVGTYVLLRLVEELCADPSVDVLDFGFGDAEYKRRFGNEAWEEADVAIFAPSFKGVRVNAVRTAIVAANRVGKRAMGSGLLARMKRVWRSRMAEGSA